MIITMLSAKVAFVRDPTICFRRASNARTLVGRERSLSLERETSRKRKFLFRR